MLKIAVLGDTESIKGYACVGLDIFPCSDEATAKDNFKKVTAGEYGIVYLTEEYAAVLEKETAKFDDRMLPAIIPIPGVKGNNGIGVKRLKDSVEMAVGSDIIFNR